MNTLAPTSPQQLALRVQHYLDQSLAPHTRRAYACTFRQYAQFCHEHHFDPIPPTLETLQGFLVYLADTGRSTATISQRLAALRYLCLQLGLSDLTKQHAVQRTLKGIYRDHGEPPNQKAAVEHQALSRMLEQCDPTTLRGLRDRAILLIGFHGAFRRAELVALTVDDLQFVPEGLRILVRRSKTDPAGKGFVKPVLESSLNPVAGLQIWLQKAGITQGFVFRRMYRNDRVSLHPLTPQSIALIVKHYGKKCDLDVASLAGHSLRAGFLTSAAKAGARPEKLAAVSGHKSYGMVMRYIRDAEAFEDHAAQSL